MADGCLMGLHFGERMSARHSVPWLSQSHSRKETKLFLWLEAVHKPCSVYGAHQNGRVEMQVWQELKKILKVQWSFWLLVAFP